ncbi:MAG: GNAT family N-acetyltransferase [Burkholderiaceae bacterium]
MGLIWGAADRDAWQALHARQAGGIQQHWAYGESLQRLGLTIARGMLRLDDDVVGLAQFGVRRVLGVLRIAHAGNGPVFATGLDAGQRSAAIAGLARALGLGRARLVLVSPDERDPAQTGLGGRRALMTGQATVLVGLDGDDAALRARLKAKWRNSLVNAEASPLKIITVGRQSPQLDWLLERDREQQQRRGYTALPAGFVTAWRDLGARDGTGADLLMLRAELGREPVGAMLFLLHGRRATYHVGWSDDRGREHGAHNLLLWRAMLMLRDKGIDALDLGGVDTQRGAGIARFKLGSGGEVRWRAGTYSI